ncbi:hypothetical protein H8959_002595 [Pygathrix nigripes]
MGEEPVPPPAAALALLPRCAPKAGWKATVAVVAVTAALCPDDGRSRGNAPGTGSRRSGSTQASWTHLDFYLLIFPGTSRRISWSLKAAVPGECTLHRQGNRGTQRSPMETL